MTRKRIEQLASPRGAFFRNNLIESLKPLGNFALIRLHRLSRRDWIGIHIATIIKPDCSLGYDIGHSNVRLPGLSLRAQLRASEQPCGTVALGMWVNPAPESA